jgi:SH3 domain protein
MRSTVIAIAVLVGVSVPAAAAEQAWVKDEHQVNVRSGPSVRYRVIAVIRTGDSVEVLDRAEGWTQIHNDEIEDGWIRAGYLQPDPPAALQVTRLEAEVQRLESRLAELTAGEADLREARDAATRRDAAQQAEIERLTHENISLRAGERWPEWLTGAGIVLLGMLLGAMVARGSGRRRPQRIKL